MLRLYLRQCDALAEAIAEIDQEIDAVIKRMDAEAVTGQASFCSLIDLLCTMPGTPGSASRSNFAPSPRQHECQHFPNTHRSVSHRTRTRGSPSWPESLPEPGYVDADF
jgi:hypothetical protein